jgi:hypothetical protein
LHWQPYGLLKLFLGTLQAAVRLALQKGHIKGPQTEAANGVWAMNKVLLIFTLATLALAPKAWAGDDCAVPMTDWQPRSAVAAVAAAQGWTIRRIRIDDGCYEVIGTDAQGRAIEAKLNPGTLNVLEIEFEDEDDSHDSDHQDGHGDAHDDSQDGGGD